MCLQNKRSVLNKAVQLWSACQPKQKANCFVVAVFHAHHLSVLMDAGCVLMLLNPIHDAMNWCGPRTANASSRLMVLHSHTHTHTHTHTYIHPQSHTDTHAYIYTYIYIYIRACHVQRHTHAHMCTQVWIIVGKSSLSRGQSSNVRTSQVHPGAGWGGINCASLNTIILSL